MNSDQLVSSCDTEDDKLLSDWVDQHADALFRFALGKVRDQHAIEDLLQETYLAALNARHAFRGESSVRSWLIAILRLKIIDYYRRKTKTREIEQVQALEADANGFREHRLAPWNDAPENTLQNEEFWEAFHSCVDKLPESLSRAYLMREMDSCSALAVCEALDISRKNLAVRVFRARTALRDCLDKHWFSKG